MKTFLGYSLFAMASFIINFLIYIYSFNQQATPYLHEEQRVESAMWMFETTLPAFLIVAVLFTLIFYFISHRNRDR